MTTEGYCIHYILLDEVNQTQLHYCQHGSCVPTVNHVQIVEYHCECNTDVDVGDHCQVCYYMGATIGSNYGHTTLLDPSKF